MTTDAQDFDPMAELVRWRRWATSILGGHGFESDEEQRLELGYVDSIAAAATAFVEEQGKTVDPEHGLIFGAEDFALDQWRDLAAAVKAAGR